MRERTLPLPVAADHPAYAGHFPGRPILPGVVLLDVALHALAAREGLAAAACRIASAKFRSPVQQGEALRLSYAATTVGDFRFEILAGDQVVASGVLAFAAAHNEDSTA